MQTSPNSVDRPAPVERRRSNPGAQASYRDQLQRFDPEVFAAIVGEEGRERAGIELIPSENYTYPEVLAALSSVLTNKYAEGYPGRRYYGGQEFTDAIEELARARARAVFRCEHANVQPLSGSPMNQAAYFAFLAPGDTVLAMDLSHGGHLTHGAPVSHMGRVFNFVRYRTLPDQAGRIDFDELRRLARETRPRIVLCGYTSYPRDYDYAAFKAIADEVGALSMADVSHVGGLIAAGLRAVMDKYLASYTKAPKNGVGKITDIREQGRTPSGRVAALTVQAESGSYTLRGNDIRFVLRDPKGAILNSTFFSFTKETSGGELSSFTVNGRGYGHGIGMCQWGAIGRAYYRLSEFPSLSSLRYLWMCWI
jgi:hypothetical protein